MKVYSPIKYIYIYIYIYKYIVKWLIYVYMCVCVGTYVHTLLSIYMNKMSGRDHENLTTN